MAMMVCRHRQRVRAEPADEIHHRHAATAPEDDMPAMRGGCRDLGRLRFKHQVHLLAHAHRNATVAEIEHPRACATHLFSGACGLAALGSTPRTAASARAEDNTATPSPMFNTPSSGDPGRRIASGTG